MELKYNRFYKDILCQTLCQSGKLQNNYNSVTPPRPPSAKGPLSSDFCGQISFIPGWLKV